MKTHHPTTAARRRRPAPGHRSPSPPASPRTIAFKRILVPVDFSAGSDRALQHAVSLALAHHARVLPLHVAPPICVTADCGYGPVNRTAPDEDSLRRTMPRLRRFVHRIVPQKLVEDTMVRSGEPIEQIVMAAAEWKADLIIMVAHDGLSGDSPPRRHTVDGLARKARCPVLLLHPSTPTPGTRSPI